MRHHRSKRLIFLVIRLPDLSNFVFPKKRKARNYSEHHDGHDRSPGEIGIIIPIFQDQATEGLRFKQAAQTLCW